jgi:hypothetical protein
VDLRDRDGLEDQVEALTSARLGGPGLVEVAGLVRSVLMDQVRAAARQGAWAMVFGQLETAGPSPAVIPVSMVGASVRGSMAGDGLEDLISAVEERHSDAVCDLLDHDGRAMLRAVRTERSAGGGLTDQEVLLTVVDYWVDAGLPSTVITATFCVPAALFNPGLVFVLDALCATVQAQDHDPHQRRRPTDHQTLPGTTTSAVAAPEGEEL